VRAGSPLLVGVLMRVSGQNGFTVVAVAMAVGAAIVALGAGAMSRAALGVSAGWMVVIGVFSWVAFGHIGMIPGGHLDNVLNAAFVISAFAAAVSFAGDRKGAVAMAVLFSAGAVAEWPFSVLAAAIFFLGLVLFAWPALRKSGEARSDVFSVVRPLALALVASAIFAGLTVLARPGGRLLHHFGQQGRMVIKERFIQRLRDPSRWYAVPPALVGGVLAARVPVKARREPGRRLFVGLLVAWVVVTVLTSAAQVLDLPVAGGRLLNYLFAIPLLAGVFFWALTRALSWRWGQTGMLLGALIAVGTAVGFGSVAWQWQIDRPPSIGPAAGRQAAAAGQYASATHPEGEVIFVQEARRHTWEELQASLPPDVVPRVKQFSGAPSDVESHTFESRSGPSGGEQLAFVLRAYNRAGYRDALGSGHW